MTAPAPLTAVVYPAAYRHLIRGRFADLATSDVRLMLATSAYTPAGTDEWITAPMAAEAAGASYTQGGMRLQNLAADLTGGAPPAVLTADPIVFAAAGWTARYAIVYAYNPGGYPMSPLLARIDLGADVSPAGDDFTVTFPAGVCRIGPGA